MSDKLVTFAHISDTHLHADLDYVPRTKEGVPHPVSYPAYPPVKQLIDFINNFEAEIDFVLHTGDVMHSPANAEEYRDMRTIFDEIKYPTYYIPGNHDHVPWFQSHFMKRKPDEITLTYDLDIEVNGVQLVLIDSHNPPEITTGGGNISPEQLHWLEKICTADDSRPMVVGIHHHTIPLLAPIDRIRIENGEDLHAVLLKAKDRLRGVFYGHIHETSITVRDGISYYSTQSGWYQLQTYYAQPESAHDPLHNPGFNLVTVTETDTFVRAIRIPV